MTLETVIGLSLLVGAQRGGGCGPRKVYDNYGKGYIPLKIPVQIPNLYQQYQPFFLT